MSNKEIVVRGEVTPLTKEEEVKLTIHLAEIDQKYGDGQPYNRDRIEGEVKTYQKQFKESLFEAGKRLILLKEHEGHGHFIESLERLEINRMTANNLMAVAQKISEDSPNVKSILHLPPTKLYDLARLNDDDLQEFEEKGEIEGLTLEEAKKMSTREFRSRIRELTAEKKHLEEESRLALETKDQLLAEKNKKIDELDGKLIAHTDPGRWSEKAEELLKSLIGIDPKFCAELSKFSNIIDEVENMKVGDWELSQIVLLEHAKYVFKSIGDRMDYLEEKLWAMAPEGNAVFHSLSSLRSAISEESQGKEWLSAKRDRVQNNV